MSLRSVTYDVGVLLGALKVTYNVTNVLKHITTQYVISDFGVVVSVVSAGDLGVVSERVEKSFDGWRHIYITSADNVNEKRYEVIWDLMRSGYMRWLRYIYSARFLNIIETDNLGGRIIEERLRIWGLQNKYKFLIEDNLEAKKIGFRRMLTQDPSFFDYMP